MTATKGRGRLLYLLLCVGAALVVLGASAVAHTFTRYTDYFLRRQDDQLQRIAAACDSNLSAQLGNMRNNLTYVVGRRGFELAEETWRQSGDTQALLFRLQENVALQDPMLSAMLVLQDGEVILSTDGQTGYTFPNGASPGRPQPCLDPNGRLHLAVMHPRGDVCYASLMDLQEPFEHVYRYTGAESARLMLLDGELLLHPWRGGYHVTPIAGADAALCDLVALEHMLLSRSSAQSLTASYRLTTPDTGEHAMRVVVLPAELSLNGLFTVGITADFDEVIPPMQASIVYLVICGGAIAAGLTLLVVLIVRIARRSSRTDAELSLLRARNEENERLLRTTQELAHHQRLETIGTLASSIAHEFNNLLTPIMSYSILTLEALPEDADDLADNVTGIYEASRKAKTIISRLTDLARKQSTAAMTRLPLDRMVCRSLEVASPAQPAHVEVKTRLCCPDAAIMGNETQIAQLLLNLILNGFQAMPEEPGRLTIQTRAEAGDVILEVRDTGKGIPPEILPRIFEPFFTTKEPGKGTGLGLAIVHQVVESHRGEVQVQSGPEGGAAFILRFPRAPEEVSPAAED